MKRKTKTDVIYRRYRNNGETIAILPEIPWGNNWSGLCTAYNESGGLIPCRVDICEFTRPAKEGEYIKLAAMLADKGYHLNSIGDFRYKHMITRKNSVMDKVIGPTVAVITMCLFIWLAWSSYPREGYTAASVAAVNDLAAQSLTPAQKRAAQIADLYHLTENDISQPFNIWRK